MDKALIKELLTGDQIQIEKALNILLSFKCFIQDFGFFTFNSLNLSASNKILALKLIIEIKSTKDHEFIICCLKDSNKLVILEAIKSLFLIKKIGIIHYDNILQRHLMTLAGEKSGDFIELLSTHLNREDAIDLIRTYFNKNDDYKVLNCLFLIEEFKLTECILIVNFCLSSSNKVLKNNAFKIRQKWITSRSELSHKNLLNNSFNKIKKSFIKKDIKLQIDCLKELCGKKVDQETLNFLISELNPEQDVYVLATLIKAISNSVCLNELEKLFTSFLYHQDAGVKSNVIDVFKKTGSLDGEKFIIDFFSKIDLKNNCFNRIIISCEDILRRNKPELLEKLLFKMSNEEITTKATLIFLLDSFDTDDTLGINPSFNLLNQAINQEMINRVIFYLKNRKTDLNINLLNKLYKQLENGSKKKKVKSLFKCNIDEKDVNNDQLNEPIPTKKIPKIYIKPLVLSSFIFIFLIGGTFTYLIGTKSKKINKSLDITDFSEKFEATRAKNKIVHKVGVVLKINKKKQSILVKSKSIEYQIFFKPLWSLKKFKIGQRVRFFGALIEETSDESRTIKGLSIFKASMKS